MNASPNSMATPARRAPAAATSPMHALRDEIADALEWLSRLLVQRVPDPLAGRSSDRSGHASEDLHAAVRFLGQVVSEWQHVGKDIQPGHAAGFGSTVEVEDIETGARETYTLMTGALLDFDGGQVSLASPIGRALLGCVPGMVVSVDTPQRRRRLHVLRLRTLHEYVQHLRALYMI